MEPTDILDLPSLEELFTQLGTVYARAERHADRLAAPSADPVSADPVADGLPSLEELFTQFYAAYAEAERHAKQADQLAAEALALLERLAMEMFSYDADQVFDCKLGGLVPCHAVRDKAKLEALTLSMEAIGWIGGPIVKLGDQLLTGSHRFAAALAAGLTEIPVIEFFDAFPLVDEGEAIEIVQTQDPWVVDLTRLATLAHPEVAAELGMDAH